MAAVRVIACLDVFQGKVVKGVRFVDHQIVGDPLELSKRYSEAGIDELVFYDIGASPQKKMFDPSLIERIAKVINIPFCVAGGIQSVTDAATAISAGADKISINSAAVKTPLLIYEIAKVLGSQAVVVGVDCRDEKVFRLTGSQETIQKTSLNVFEWCTQVEKLGAGEIVLNCMDSDGTKAGGNTSLMKALRNCISIPLVASGGLGSPIQFKEMIWESGISGALGASIFHFEHFSVSDVKNCLLNSGIEVRV